MEVGESKFKMIEIPGAEAIEVIQCMQSDSRLNMSDYSFFINDSVVFFLGGRF